MTVLHKIIVASLVLASVEAHAEKRAIVFGTTCPEYESTLDDVEGFVSEATGELDPLKNAGWNVIPYLGGSSVWDTKRHSLDKIMQKSSFKSFQANRASRVNLLAELNRALTGPTALAAGDELLVSVITHGNQTSFCSSDGLVTYDTVTPIFKKLKDKGVKLGFDANHCFSGGPVTTLSPYACVVSVASSTTTGLGGSTTLQSILGNADLANPTLEDLYLARTVSYNASFNMRQPEISGFSFGNAFNDAMSDRMYPGEKYDLTNNTLVARCDMEGGYGPNCDLLRNSMGDYFKMLRAFEAAHSVNDHSREWSSLLTQYPDRLFNKIVFPPANLVTDDHFEERVSASYLRVQSAAQQIHTLMQSEKDGLNLISQSSFVPMRFDPRGIAFPNTEDALAQAVNHALDSFVNFYINPNGSLKDPSEFSRIFTPKALSSIAHEGANQYYLALAKQRDASMQVENSASDGENNVSGEADLVQNQASMTIVEASNLPPAHWEALILERLNASMPAYFQGLRSPSTTDLMNFLMNYARIFSDRSGAQQSLHTEYQAFQYMLSGRVSYKLLSNYLDYRDHLAGTGSLNTKELSDKSLMDSCLNFKLR